MDALQKNRLSSYKLMIKVAEDEKETVDTIQYFAEGIVDLKVIVSEIDEKSVSQNKDLSGITVEKNYYLTNCKELLNIFSGALSTYATKKADKVLLKLVDYSKAKINKYDQQDLVKVCRAVLAEVHKLPAGELASAGITAEDIAEFETSTNCLDDKKDTRKGAIIEQKSDNKQILQLFDKAQELKVNVLDRLAPQFERKHPVFYSKYKDAATVHYKHNNKKDDSESNADTDSNSDTDGDTSSSKDS